jgi:hypothetical protein
VLLLGDFAKYLSQGKISRTERNCRQKKREFYSKEIIFLSLVVFEIIKQEGCYEYFFELSYSRIIHGLQNNSDEENRKETLFDFSLR